MIEKLALLKRCPAPVRILALLVILVVGWLPIAVPIALLVRDANLVTIVTMSLLFVGFLLLIRLWGKAVHQDKQIFRTYGLVWSRQNGVELLTGLGISFVSLLSLFLVQSWLGWVSWQVPSWALIGVMAQGALTGLGTGLAEELVFRGWMLDELQRDYNPRVALWTNALTFACLHFIKPIAEVIRTFPQFPGLVLLGLTLVWARRSTAHKIRSASSVSLHGGRLGFPIGLHAGLVWAYYICNVGQLITYTDRVPTWITGIDRNPLAGVIGILFLSGLALWVNLRSRHTQMRLRSLL